MLSIFKIKKNPDLNISVIPHTASVWKKNRRVQWRLGLVLGSRDGDVAGAEIQMAALGDM